MGWLDGARPACLHTCARGFEPGGFLANIVTSAT